MRTPDYKEFSKGRCLGGNTGGTCIIGAIWLLSTSLAILLLGGLAWQWRQCWCENSGITGCRLRAHRLRRGTRVTVRAHPPEREDAHSFEWTVILSKLTPCYICHLTPLDSRVPKCFAVSVQFQGRMLPAFGTLELPGSLRTEHAKHFFHRRQTFLHFIEGIVA